MKFCYLLLIITFNISCMQLYLHQKQKKFQQKQMHHIIDVHENVEDEEDCPICLEKLPRAWPQKIKLHQGEQWSHDFCNKCLNQALTKGNQDCPTCPKCRTKISPGQVWKVRMSKECSRQPITNQLLERLCENGAKTIDQYALQSAQAPLFDNQAEQRVQEQSSEQSCCYYIDVAAICCMLWQFLS